MTRGMQTASRDQVIILQTLYAQWKGHAIEEGSGPRSARLAWASDAIGRPVSSFSELTRDEARQLIDGLKGSMGLALTEKPQPWRRIRSRERAQAAGTAGRRDASSSLLQMAGPDDFARIDEALHRLGWTRDRYEAWLNSASSPLPEKGVGAIRTVAEVNKVWWALKNMLKRSGSWRPQPQKRLRQTFTSSI